VPDQLGADSCTSDLKVGLQVFMIVYSPKYELDLQGHIWPTVKYRLIAERLVAERVVASGDLVPPPPCSWDDLALVHTHEYLSKVRNGTLSEDEILTLELPWLPELVDGFRLMTGGTCLAAELALERGSAIHLGGGLHHAFPNHGEGFCLFNDIGVAIRRLQRDKRIARAAVIDCDVHHGNGTAVVFARDPSVFTFSIHQQHNYPLFKPPSDLDVGLTDGAGDREYLARLEEALPVVLRSSPELVVYVAGADPYRGDRLGGLGLSIEGLRTRDHAVITAVRSAGAPLAVVLAGGYAVNVEDTVEVHVGTVREMLNAESL
jgi:acetoin utilization deacetylase AcuC-like enzyme